MYSSSEESETSKEIDDLELREVQKLEGHSDRVWSIAWNPAAGGSSGTPAVFASCSGDKTIRIWEQSSISSLSFHCKAVLEGAHTKTVRSCAWSPSGETLATASFDSTIAIWKNIGGEYKCTFTFKGHKNEVKSVSWSMSGCFVATCGRDKSIWIWEVREKDEYCIHKPWDEFDCASVLEGHTQDVKMVVWHPDANVLFSCSFDNSIKIWELDDEFDEWCCVQTLNVFKKGHTSTVWALAFNAVGDKFVSCSDDLTIKIWVPDALYSYPGELPSCTHWRLLGTLSGYHERTIFSVDWSRNGVIATGAADNGIRLFAAEMADELDDGTTYELAGKVDTAHEMDVNCVQWSPTQMKLLASASDDGTIKIWELIVHDDEV